MAKNVAFGVVSFEKDGLKYAETFSESDMGSNFVGRLELYNEMGLKTFNFTETEKRAKFIAESWNDDFKEKGEYGKYIPDYHFFSGLNQNKVRSGVVIDADRKNNEYLISHYGKTEPLILQEPFNVEHIGLYYDDNSKTRHADTFILATNTINDERMKGLYEIIPAENMTKEEKDSIIQFFDKAFKTMSEKGLKSTRSDLELNQAYLHAKSFNSEEHKNRRMEKSKDETIIQ